MTSTKHFFSLCVQQTSIIYWIKESSQSKHSRLLIGSSIYHGEINLPPQGLPIPKGAPGKTMAARRVSCCPVPGSILFCWGKTAREWNYFMDFWCMRSMAICYRHTLSYFIWLVVWLPFLAFSHILGLIIPIDFHIFQRGGLTTNQLWIYIVW